MIHEEICTYEVSKLAKEKGFNWMPSMYFHSGVESDLRVVGVNGANPNKIPHSPHISCPTQTQLQRWLRENHGADVWVDTAATMATKNQRCYYWHIAYDSDGSCIYVLDSMLSYSTYEKALEEGLKEAMIEFVEERK